ncbi:MAG: hypothetical protein ACLUV5_13390 [Oscillospiraceae bacterium]
MAVNPKIIMMVAQAAKSEKVRKAVLYIVFMTLGLIMMIFVVFTGLISGLFAVIENTNLKNHWDYMRANISEVFNGIEGEINSDVKDEVYDFMPEFSVNLSKATIANNFDGSSLILYDEDEISRAENIMRDYAGQLRAIKSQDELVSYISDFDTELSFSDISSIQFTDDKGIDNLSEYSDELKIFLYHRAMEQMSKYNYTFEKVEVDGKPADRQTLVVTAADGSTQTVEYTCIGGGEIYLPEFLAMYHIRQVREYLIKVTENKIAEDVDSQLASAVGDIPDTQEQAQEYIESSWNSMINGKGAINLNIFEVSNLKTIMENANMDGAVKIETERSSDRLSITLETVGSDVWKEIFQIEEDLWKYVEQTQSAIEMALTDAEIPEEEWTISLDNMVQLALFVYFEGFFELPVSSSDLAPGGNGILSQCGDVSDLHQYTYGTKDMGVPERGITLELTGRTTIHADLLNCGSCIQDAFIYDVWNMDEQNIANDTNSNVFNQSAVTIAYIIDTQQFEEDYGFPFPTINGLRGGNTITLFLEFTCLSEVEFEDLDIGSPVDLENLTVGYSHDGYYSDTYDKGLWRHHLNRDECIPHVGIKTYFMSGEAAAPDPPQGTHYYGGPSAKDIGVVANPRLWFKAFRTGMSDELFETIKAVEPD